MVAPALFYNYVYYFLMPGVLHFHLTRALRFRSTDMGFVLGGFGRFSWVFRGVSGGFQGVFGWVQGRVSLINSFCCDILQGAPPSLWQHPAQVVFYFIFFHFWRGNSCEMRLNWSSPFVLFPGKINFQIVLNQW